MTMMHEIAREVLQPVAEAKGTSDEEFLVKPILVALARYVLDLEERLTTLESNPFDRPWTL